MLSRQPYVLRTVWLCRTWYLVSILTPVIKCVINLSKSYLVWSHSFWCDIWVTKTKTWLKLKVKLKRLTKKHWYEPFEVSQSLCHDDSTLHIVASVTIIIIVCKNKKAVLSQRWPRNAPYTWMPWKFSGLPDYAHGYYSQHFHGLLFGSTLWMFLPNLKSVAWSVPDIIGGTQKSGQSLDTCTLFFRKFLMGFYLDWPYKCTRKIWSP